MKPQKRLVSVYIDDDMYDEIVSEKKEDDSFNKTLVHLIRQSLKERDRLRKKNASKKIPS
jgi:predicted CopG family antitoxin